MANDKKRTVAPDETCKTKKTGDTEKTGRTQDIDKTEKADAHADWAIGTPLRRAWCVLVVRAAQGPARGFGCGFGAGPRRKTQRER